MRCCITTRVGHASTEIPPPPPQRFIFYGLFGWASVIVLLTARPNRAACAPGASGWGRWVGRTG